MLSETTVRRTLWACGTLALSPLLPWLLALVFSRIDRSWLGAPAAMQVTVPVAMGTAAILLGVFGLQRQRFVMMRLREQYEQIEADGRPLLFPVAVPVGPVAGAVAGIPADAADGPVMVVEDDPGGGSGGPSGGDRAKAAAVAAAKRQGAREAKALQRQVGRSAKREARQFLRDTF